MSRKREFPVLFLLPVIFVSLCVIVPVSEAVLAAMSVDIGSQFMKIGLVKPGVPMEIVLNRESRRKTPSIVSLRGDERTFADQAAHSALRFPKDAFLHLTDLLGKKLDNPMVHLFHKRFPYYNLIADPHRGTVLFEHNGETYSPETLIAMLISDARKVAERFAEQPVKDCVITVPPYFNQAERRAMAVAAKIAGVNLLQLMNDNTAAGLNYGMFRRKQFNESATTVLLFDMGATKTTATVFEFQLVKDKSTNEKNPQMTVMGIGYDRTLGGLEMTLRLRDRLVNDFQKNYKTNGDVTENARAMAKFLKEAERVKQVLSANPNHIAQIEHVFEETDFRTRVTREELEELCADIFDRVAVPVKDALKMAELNADQIDTVLIMGAATRSAKVQEKLKLELNGKELGKFLNTDEAIALGAVYQAAHLSKGFKVKKFGIKEANIFPIQVDFTKETNTSETEKRIIHRVLFGLKNPYPQKKVMTFSKHTKDFEFAVNYGDLKHLSHDQLSEFGEVNISRVDLTGVGDAYSANMEKGTEFKGIKAHFKMDESGILNLDNTELIVEKMPKEEESTLSAIGNKIRGLFGSSSETTEKPGEETVETPKDEEKSTEEKTTDTEQQEPTKPEEANDKREETEKKEETEKQAEGEKSKSDEKKAEETKNTTEAKNATKKAEPKPTIVKISLKMEQSCMDITNMTKEEVNESLKRLSKFDTIEKEKEKREAAQNHLESFVFETGDKLEQEEYQYISTEAEREEIRAKLKEMSVWMDDEADINTKTEEFETKLKTLKDATKDFFFKHEQAKERPQAVAALNQMLNHSNMFLASIKNLTDDLQIFTKTEIETLEKLINDTEKWWTRIQAEQAKLAGHEKPALTLYPVAEKITALDRELKYLLNKAKRTPPPKPKNETASANKTEETIPKEKEDSSEKTEKDKTETPDEAPSEPVIEPEPEETPETEEQSETKDAESKEHKEL